MFNSVQLLSRVQLFETPWTAAHQATLSITNSQSLLKLMSFKSVMPSNHLILCHSLLLLPSIFPSIRVFSSYTYTYVLSVLSLLPSPPSYYNRSSRSTELSSLCEWTCGHWAGRGVWDERESSPDIFALLCVQRTCDWDPF